MFTFNFTISTDDERFAGWLKGYDDNKVKNTLLSHFSERKNDHCSDRKNEIKTSFVAGVEGEQSVIDTLLPVYELEFRGSHAGDIIAKRVGKSVLVEVKNYSTTVPYKEIEKFHRDLDTNVNMVGGLFISLRSPITKIGKSISFTKRNHQYIIYLTSPDRDTILTMTGLLFDINEHRVVNVDKLAREIDNLEELRANLVQTHSSMSDLKSTFDRSIDLIIKQTYMLESKFGESIRNLAESVATNEVVSELKCDIVSFITSKFADSALARNEHHRNYMNKFIKRFDLDGNFNIKNKTTIMWAKSSANLLKTKTALVFEHCHFSVGKNDHTFAGKYSYDSLSKYDIKIDGDFMKVEIKPKNYPLLDVLFAKPDLICFTPQ